jgi:hypothetical protein
MLFLRLITCMYTKCAFSGAWSNILEKTDTILNGYHSSHCYEIPAG